MGQDFDKRRPLGEKAFQHWDGQALLGSHRYRAVLYSGRNDVLRWATDIRRDFLLRRVYKRWGGRLVLDVGCGIGRWTLRMAKLGVETVGIDISQGMINEAKARATRVKLYFGLTFLRASAAEIPFKDQSFDAVLSVIVLHHLEDNQWRKAFSKIVRVTKPGGTIALLEWAGASAPRVLMPLMTFRPYAQWMGLFSRENVSVQDVLGVDPVSGILASGLQNILFHAGAIVSSRRRGSGRSWTRKFKETCIWGIVTIGIVALVPIDMLCCRAFWRYATNKLFLLKKGYSHRSISAGTCPDTSTI